MNMTEQEIRHAAQSVINMRDTSAKAKEAVIMAKRKADGDKLQDKLDKIDLENEYKL